MYQPLAQSYRPSMNLIVSTSNDLDGIGPVVQTRLRSLEPALAIFNVRTLAEHVGTSLYVERMESTLLAFFGLLALVLTAIGIYGSRGLLGGPAHARNGNSHGAWSAKKGRLEDDPF